jgi:hypothetical protein
MKKHILSILFLILVSCKKTAKESLWLNWFPNDKEGMLKNSSVVFLFGILLISFSCSQYTKNISETEYAFDDTFSLEIDSIIIPLDSVSLPSYMSGSAYYEDDTCSLLFAFNSRTWNLDVFNLNSSKIEKHIQLIREGKDAITDVLSVQIITPDSLLIHDGYNFIFIDGTGKVLSRISGVSEQRDYLSFLDLTSPTTLPYFNLADNKIYGRYATTRRPYPAIEKELFSTFDVSNKTWQILPVKTPDYYDRIYDKLGRNTVLNTSFHSDRVSYNFAALSDVFVYFPTNNKEIVRGGSSKLMNNKVWFYNGDKHSDEAKWKHYLENPVFGPIIYNPHQKKYYRIAFGDFIESSSHESTNFYDKKIILSVFDESLRLIFESALPNYKLFLDQVYFATSRGLFVFGNNPMNPELNYEELVVYMIRLSPNS